MTKEEPFEDIAKELSEKEKEVREQTQKVEELRGQTSRESCRLANLQIEMGRVAKRMRERINALGVKE